MFSSKTIEEKLVEKMGASLPIMGKPLGSYVPAQRHGNMVHTSGQLPFKDGKLMATGKVGKDVTEEMAMECAKQCAFHCLNAVKSVIGDLGYIEKIMKVNVFVNSAPGFTNQPKVANGASDLLVQVFGEAGKHARAAVGVVELPLNTPVEIDMVVAVKDPKI